MRLPKNGRIFFLLWRYKKRGSFEPLVLHEGVEPSILRLRI